MAKGEDITVVARNKALADLFEKTAWVQGRLYGKSGRGDKDVNPFKGTNITFGIRNQIVSVCKGQEAD